MQIYKDMNIGTAKVMPEEMQGIEHYMLDFVSPDERYNVSEFKNKAEEAIKRVLSKGKVPIIVGGTGLYIDSLIYGIEFQQEEFDEDYRNSLNEIADKGGLDELYNEAKKIDPKAMEKISPNDKKRIIRVLARSEWIHVWRAPKWHKWQITTEEMMAFNRILEKRWIKVSDE